MCALALLNWLKAPASREIIRRWTRASPSGEHSLDLRLPDPGEAYEVLVVGDTGDAEVTGSGLAPQDAVARYLAEDACLPGSAGKGLLVLHTGDVVYMTGERRLYERNFRRPFAPFLTPDSTVDRLVFRIPFLPVPGNHDYYDFAPWAAALARAPAVGAGLRAVARELFAFSVPQGGSDQGRAFMDAFLRPEPSPLPGPLPYIPGEITRLPNRYYRFRVGSVDYFALDSNTLEAPSPSPVFSGERAQAERRVKLLRKHARQVDHELRQLELELEELQRGHRRRVALSLRMHSTFQPALSELLSAAKGMATLLERNPVDSTEGTRARRLLERTLGEWEQVQHRLLAATGSRSFRDALDRADTASRSLSAALKAADGYLGHLPEGLPHAELSTARGSLEAALQAWTRLASPPPPSDLAERLHHLSDTALDIQRTLAVERRRAHSQPEDFDQAQIRWLDAALAESVRERPDNWRVVYLHHPLYSTITNHCELADIQGVRANLIGILRGRVHAVFGGHAHAFEWTRSRELPHTGLFVTGGGGQVSLRRSILDPRRFARHSGQYAALRTAGVTEAVVCGRGPAAADGEDGNVFHYLRVQVTPERLIIRPVGVRQTAAGFRREEPVLAFHASSLPVGQPPWEARTLEGIAIRRDQPPEPIWT